MTEFNPKIYSSLPKIDPLLNDPETNYLADLFLARYRIKSARRYRLFKNAVIAFSHAKFDASEIFDMLASSADMTTAELLTELRTAIDELPEPISTTFNRHYSPTDAEPKITMSDNKSPNYIFGFLGYAFLIIIINNYPIYNAVKLMRNQ